MFSLNPIRAQTGYCDPDVPSFTVNLSSSSAGIWVSPDTARQGNCCGLSNSDLCVHFNLTLNPNAAGVQIDMIGADPPGSLTYSFSCTAPGYPGGTVKCISGVGPHDITFCKPGKNKNIYKITSISKPLFPKDDTVRVGCRKKLVTLGIVNNSASWTAINSSAGSSPAQLAIYNSYLDSLNVASPTYSPAANAPSWIAYQVCGFPIASTCGFSLNVCGTLTITNVPSLTATVTPNPATFCNIGPGSGVVLNATGGGGLSPYIFNWYNGSNVFLASGAVYTATAQGAYKLEIKDRLYNSSTCPSTIISPISVSVGLVPTVDAGSSQKICASNPVAILSGTINNASGGIWTGGLGTFVPGNTYLNTNYTPHATELSAGFVKLYLTSTGSGGGCINKKDSTIIYFSSTPTVSINSGTLSCHNSTTTISAYVSGGTPPYNYLWNTGTMGNSVIGGQGNYSVIVKDSLNCSSINTSKSISAPSALSLLFYSTNVVPDGSSTGTASVSISGGTPVYTVTWTPGGLNTFSLSGLPYGVYTAQVKDANGCRISGSTVVGNSLCSSLTAIGSSTNILCFGESNGKASVNVIGGTPAYTYTWNTSPEQYTATANNLQSGVYTVLVKDGNNCFQTANITITEPTLLTNVMTHTNVTIMGGSNGVASANPFGGSVPYSYLWSTGATSQSINNLSAGIYTVGITDKNGCTRNDAVNLSQPICNDLTLNLFVTNALCYGGKGSAFAIISGAKGTYTVNWSNGAQGLSVTGLAPGNYSVSVADTSHCLEYFNFTITQPSPLSLGLTTSNVSCYGVNNGAVDLSISGGTFPYFFNWNSGFSSSEDLTNLPPGSYSVQTIDANGCSAIASAIITQPTPLAVTYTTQNVSCINGSNGIAQLNVSGGTIPYTYAWSTGATTQSITGLSAGGYTASVVDANLCKTGQALVIPIAQPDSVKVDSFIIACSVPGSGKTQVQVVPKGGYSGVYQVSYDNGLSFQTAGVYVAMLNNATTYSVVLKDANNCWSLKPDIISVKKEVKIDSVIFNKCYSVGTNSTIVTIYPSGGDSGPYSVSYNNGISYLAQGTYSANIGIASTYSVLTKDFRGCISGVKVITLPSVFSSSTSATSDYHGQNISCYGLTDGSALVTASGGTGSYSYSWTTVPTKTTAAISNLGAGTYTVTIKDLNNCSITNTITLTQSTAITATASVTSNYNGQAISCFGYNDGEAHVIANGGTTPYTYAWTFVPTQTASTATGLIAGTYSVYVKDVNNCLVTKTVTLTQPVSLTSTVNVTSNYNGKQVSCYGATNASITAIASSGTAPYTYAWSTNPVQTGTIVTGVGAGTYSVIITDANGCVMINSTAVTEPKSVSITASVTSHYNGHNISCFGLTDGSATSNATGGTEPYNYIWSSTPSQSGVNLSNVGAGNYTVTIFDANQCEASASVNLTQADKIEVQLLDLSSYNGYNISCFGKNDGYIDITVKGGIDEYTYQWSNSATTEDLSNLTAGNYSVTVYDMNQCKGQLNVKLFEPNKLIATVDSISHYNNYNISCFGLHNGNIYVSVIGGVKDYNYTWSNNSVNQDLTNVGAGSYSLTVIDNNRCMVSLDTLLIQPLVLTLESSVSPVLCHGIATGSIDVSLAGGVSPYAFNWSTNSTQEDLKNIGAGTYTITYRDKNGCGHFSVIQVTEPDSIKLNKEVDNLKCNGDTLGNIYLITSGGIKPYTYLWSDESTIKDLTNVKAGQYSVIIKDNNGCIYNDTTVITEPTSLKINLYSPILYSGYNISKFNGDDGSIDLTVTGGITPYTYLWSNGSSIEDIYNLKAGNYYVTVMDTNGCRISGDITLTQPLSLEMPEGYSPNNDNQNDNFVVHGIESYPDNTLTIYNRWGNIVYSKEGYFNEWNGNSNNGEVLPDATYFAILEVNGGEIVLKGYVELRR